MKIIWILSLLVVHVWAKTALQKTCETYAHGFFHGHSCFIGSDVKKNHPTAVTECPKPKANLPTGHLAYILTNETLEAVFRAFKDGTLDGTHYYLGLQQFGPEGAGGKDGWTWIHPTLPNRLSPHHDMILWSDPAIANPHVNWNTEDIGSIVYHEPGLRDFQASIANWYLCEYEEPTFRMYNRCYHNKIGHNATFIADFHGYSRVDCAKACAADLMCRSFTFNNVTGHCIIHWTDGAMENFEPINQNGYNFFVSHYSYNKVETTFPCNA